MIRFTAGFWKVYSRRMFLCFYFLWSISYVLTAKIVPDLNNSLIFTWCERATVSKSLHVRSNFRCLIMAYTKLIQFVYARHSFVSKIYKKYQSSLFWFLFELPSGGYIVQFTPHFMCWKYFDECFMDKNLLHISLTKFNKLNKRT